MPATYPLDDPFADLPDAKPAAAAAPEAAKVGSLQDMIRAAGSGVRSGVESLVGLPGDVGYGMRWLTDQGRQGLGYEARPDYVEGSDQPIPDLPTSWDVRGVTDEAIGEGYKPQTRGGKYAKTIGEFLPGALAGPGGVARNLVTQGAIPAVASETAGQLTEGTSAEPWARGISALGAGLLASGRKIPETAEQLQRREAVEAAKRQGMTIPEAAMADKGPNTFVAAKLAEIPLVGEPLKQSARKTVTDIGDRVDSLAHNTGNVDKAVAGSAAKGSLMDWIETESSLITKQAYDAVDGLVNPTLGMTPMNTKRMKKALEQEQAGSTGTAFDDVIKRVDEITTRPGGATYHDLKRLRTEIGDRLSGKITPEPGTSQPGLDRIYGALTEDMRHVIGRSGKAALKKWEEANDLNRVISEQRNSLAEITGIKGQRSTEAVFAGIENLMRDSASGNVARLKQVRTVMEKAGTWDNMKASIIHRLGRDPSSPTGVFSPARMLSSYGKMSSEAKDVMFGAARADLDDLARISEMHRGLQRMGNPSGTGGVGGLLTLGTAILVDPITAAAGVLGGAATARMMARPASARKMVNWARARNAIVEGGPVASANALADATRAFARDAAEETGMPFQAAVDALSNPQDEDPFADLPEVTR